jgi:hypothetical protein
MADLPRLLGSPQAIDNQYLSEDDIMKAQDVQQQLDTERLEYMAQMKAKDKANMVGYI